MLYYFGIIVLLCFHVIWEMCCFFVNSNMLQWYFNRNSYIFIQENVFENAVWKMAATLSRPVCVNSNQDQ